VTTSAPPPSSSSPASSRGERRRRRKRVRKDKSRLDRRTRLFFAAFTAVGVALALLASYVFVVFPNGAGPGQGKDVEVVVELDEPRSSVVEKLDKAGLVRSPGLFALWVRLTAPRFAPGRHLLTDDASPQELVRRLERLGAASRAKVTIPEGWNRFDIARRLKALHVTPEDAFVEATQDHDLLVELAIDAESAEGYLFPATYEIPRDSDAKDVVRRMKSEFDRRFAQLEQNHHLGRIQLESSLGWGRREILTLASMVEKEAAVDEERPIIASVFLNRLRDPNFKKKVLQCDPTAGYGCLVMKDRVPSCAGYSGKITHAINTDPLNRYSTYVHEGLPPGPIGNPGMKSLQAVLAPSQTKYLYFVAREGRRHTFSETLEEHNAAVKDLRDRTSNRDHAP
jgi:UPF0755 protein